MQKDYVNQSPVRIARLSSEHRERLEALRDEVSTSRWRMATEVYELREDYRREVEDRMYAECEFPRSEIADACGVLPQDVDEMLLTYERVGCLAGTSGLDICYNAWKYIARHEDPQAFLDEILDDMINWGGKFPPVSVIRMKLAASKGNASPPKPRKWEGGEVQEMLEFVGAYSVTIWFHERPPDLERGTSVTLVEEPQRTAPDEAGRAKAGA